MSQAPIEMIVTEIGNTIVYIRKTIPYCLKILYTTDHPSASHEWAVTATQSIQQLTHWIIGHVSDKVFF